MSDALEHFKAGEPGFTAQLNRLVDAFNELAEKFQELEKALDSKADKTARRSSKASGNS